MSGTNQASNLSGLFAGFETELQDPKMFNRGIENTFRPDFGTTEKGLLEAAAWEAKMGRAQEANAMTAASQQKTLAREADLETAQLAAQQTQFDSLAGALSTARKELNAPTQGMITRGDSNRAQQMLDDFQRVYVPQPGASTEYKEAYNAGVNTLQKGVEAAGNTDVEKTAAGVLQLESRLADPNDPLAKNDVAAEQVRKHIKQVKDQRPEVVDRMNEMTLKQLDVASGLRNQKKAQDAAKASGIVGAYAGGVMDHEAATKALSAQAEAGNTEAAAELETINKIQKMRGEATAADVTIETAPGLVAGYEAQIKSLKDRNVDVGLYETKLESLKTQAAEPGKLKATVSAFRQEARGLETMLNQAMIAEDRRVRSEEAKAEEKRVRDEATITRRSYSGQNMEGFASELQTKYGDQLETSNLFGFGGDDAFHWLGEDDDGKTEWNSRLDDLEITAMMRDRDRALVGLDPVTYVLGEDNLPIYNKETKDFYRVGEAVDKTSSAVSAEDPLGLGKGLSEYTDEELQRYVGGGA